MYHTDLNSFESDIRRAILSRRFFAGLLAELVILMVSGMNSEAFCISVPILCTLPYTTVVLEDLQSGFIKSYLPRTNRKAYIYGKAYSCMLSGGLVLMLSVFLFAKWKQSGIEGKIYLFFGGSRFDMNYPGEGKEVAAYYGLLFLSGALWALVSTTLSVWTKSRYIAYGSSFVIYYLLVILQQRYAAAFYMMNPMEWFQYQHIWVFGQWGIGLMLAGIMLIVLFLYVQIVERRIAQG